MFPMKRFPLALVAAFAIVLPLSISATNMVSGLGSENPAVETHIDRGVIKVAAGDYAAARGHFDQAIQLDPKSWRAYYDRAVLSFLQSKWNPALSDVNKAMSLHRKYLQVAILRAEINGHLGRYDSALTELDHLVRAIRLSEDTAQDVYNLRAWIRATSHDRAFRNGGLAVADAIRACNLSRWKSYLCLDTLAAAYAENGDFESAVRSEQKAIDALSTSKEKGTNLAGFQKLFGQRLATFAQHKIPSYD